MTNLKSEAKQIKDSGSPLTIEQILAFLERTEADKTKRIMRKRALHQNAILKLVK